MTQIALRDVTLSHLSLPLFKNATLYINQGERIALIGRNGAGKSSLLKLLQGELAPDHGTVEHSKSLTLALLPQAVPENLPGTVKEIVSSHLKMDPAEDWQDLSVIDMVISKLQLDPNSVFNGLSGGLKRLVLLACILVQKPDVLLLDEPTNHLDIDKILLLENLLMQSNQTIFFVTHDRTLLQKLATHIVEIDNGKLLSWKGSYREYLMHKETMLHAEEKANALFDKKLAQEEVWIRQGIKARRTRNEGRVRLLKKMRQERSLRRERIGKVNLDSVTTNLTGKIVFEANKVSFSFQNKNIIKNFSTLILRGDKVGIIGPNGAGKSTLINLLLGKLTPDQGEIKIGTNIEVGYFDQLRAELDPEKTIIETVAELGNTIRIGDKEKHVMSYLQDFLFSPTQARSRIKNLSGGERNRVLLAKILSKPCNVLVLDEPTNDLDIETLELLEEMLVDYNGTLLLISHDRTFLDNIVTSTFVFTGNGQIEEFVGGYNEAMKATVEKTSKSNTPAENIKQVDAKEDKKLSYKETKELESLPSEIEALELKQSALQEKLADPTVYKNESELAIQLSQELSQLEDALAKKFARWEELDKKAQNS